MNGVEFFAFVGSAGALCTLLILRGVTSSEEWGALRRQERALAAMGRTAERCAR